jgi:hypothetical protein
LEGTDADILEDGISHINKSGVLTKNWAAAGCPEGGAHGDGPAASASGDCSTIADGVGLRLAEMLAAS